MKKVTKFVCVAAALVLSVAMLLTGCVAPVTPQTPSSPQDSTAGNTPAAPAKEAVELIWYLVGPQQEPETDKILEAANPI